MRIVLTGGRVFDVVDGDALEFEKLPERIRNVYEDDVRVVG